MNPSTQTNLLTNGEGIFVTNFWEIASPPFGAAETASAPNAFGTQATKEEDTSLASTGPIIPSEVLGKPLLQLLPVNFPDVSGWEILKRYEGVVIAIEEEVVHARFKETADDFPELEAKIATSEIPNSQRALLREGAFLVWLIGYTKDAKGATRRESSFYIRRILRPSYSGKELNRNIRDSLRAIHWE
jgi:hypothetical protein